METLVNILSSLCTEQDGRTASLVHSITLTLYVDDYDYAPGKNLAVACSDQLQQIDRDLGRLTHLRELKITRRGIEISSFTEDDKASLRKAFPLLHNRGAVDVW